ncbi:TonB-dependent receptor [Porphyromonadaceae bacterium W3.11]|nr:TonB-dependent receptor [Porphyromonadaceae bacterium W3.11]
MKSKILMLSTLLLLAVGTALGQTINVKGVVFDENGEPMIGATVRAKNDASNGAQTNFDGEFALPKAVKQGEIIIISSVGYKTQELPAATDMKVNMKADSELLDEVVVVAYGTAKKESLTGAIAVVDSKELDKRVSTSVTAALEGTASGVQVNSTYGEPGAAPKIRIRGIGTLGAQSPLYVVDGVPFEGNIAELNSNDIANMSILKDAASTALYGNRAANGVVMITTKSGKRSVPSVNVSFNQGLYQRGLPEYDRLDPTSWMEAGWNAMRNYAISNGSLGMTPENAAKYASENLMNDYVKRNIFDKPSDQLFDANGNFLGKVLPGYTDLNWADALERLGARSDYNISGSYSNDKMNVYASVGYLNEKGYIIASDYERFTGRINTGFTPNEWLSLGINLSAAHTNRNYNDNASGSMYKNPFSQARYMAPVYPIYEHDEKGEIVVDENGDKVYDTTSPYLSNRHIVYELLNDRENSKRNVMGLQTYATFELPYGLSATIRGDLNKSTTNSMKYDNKSIGDGQPNGRLTEYAYQYTNYTLQQLLNWNYTFDDAHNVEFLFGHENFNSDSHFLYGMNTDMAVDGPLVMNNFLTNSYFNGYENVYRTESYFSRLKYNYLSKYIIEGSFRRDGSSRFHPDNRWGNFYSVGGSWNISQEDFMQDVNWVDFLKLRASYGEVGNDASVGLYGHMALYDIDKNGGKPALVKKSLSAHDIKWETTQTFDIGVDGRLFNQLDFSLGYFDKRSLDLLFEVKLPLSAGSYPHDDAQRNMVIWQNIGSISNRGVELSLNWDIFNREDFAWSIGTEATFIKNKVLKLPNGEEIPSGSLRRIAEGHSIYEFHTYHFEGVDQLTGRSLYTLDPEKKENAIKDGQLVTINGTDYTMDTSFGLRDWRGSAIPKFYGSFNTNLSWKGFGLYMLFTYSVGGKTYDGSYASLMSTPSASSASAIHVDVKNSWDGAPEGMKEDSPNRIDPNGTPALDFFYSNRNNALSDRWLVDSSYLVFKNLNLTYDLPTQWVEKLGLANVQLSFGAENLFTLTARKGMNPQYSFSGGQDDTYVTARVYNFGLKFKF